MMKTRIFWDKFEALLTNKLLNKYYYGTTGLKRYLQKRLNLKSALRLREMDNVMFEAIQEVVRLRKNRIVPDAGKYTDGIFLIEEILKRKPKRILECGSGASSIAIAYAVKCLSDQGHECSFTSMEQHKEFLEQYVLPAVPSQYEQYVNFVVSDISLAKYTRENLSYCGVFYSNVPGDGYDFMYIDGPAFIHKEHYLGSINPDLMNYNRKLGKPIDADCINILKGENTDKTTLIVDQRIATRHAILKLSNSIYASKYYPIVGKSVIEIKTQNFKDVSITSLPE